MMPDIQGGTWAAAGVVLGGALASLGAWLLKFIPLRNKIQREERADALVEYQKITERYQGEIVQLRTELHAVNELHWRCEIEQERLRGEVKVLTQSVQRIQAHVGDESPATIQPTLVIANLDGIIKHISPAVAPMFHWMPTELIGKNIETLMAERYKLAHRTALEALKSTGSVPWTERVLLGHALTKDGKEFPVAVTLSAWKDDKQVHGYSVSAEIRQRPSAVQEPESAKQTR